MKTPNNFRMVWLNMKRRCLDPKYPTYKLYGERGIAVCDEWLSYEKFEEDMYEDYGYLLEKYGQSRKMISLERVDNNKGYFKENCRWASMKDQAQNRRERKVWKVNPSSLRQKVLAANSTINYFTVMYRLKSGWSFEEAVNKPVAK